MALWGKKNQTTNRQKNDEKTKNQTKIKEANLRRKKKPNWWSTYLAEIIWKISVGNYNGLF